MIEHPEPPYSVTEVAGRLGVTTKTVRAWCREGRLGAVWVGGQWRIPAEELAAWLEQGTRTRLSRYARPEFAVTLEPRR